MTPAEQMSGDPYTMRSRADCQRPTRLSFLDSDEELDIAIRVPRALPAIANRKFCIWGVNSRLSGTF